MSAAVQPRETRPKGGIRGRVLVVDDEEVIASTLEEFLVGERFEVRVAGESEVALRTCEQFEPDVVLCDVQLPGLDGLELLDRLLQVRPETMVLMITAYATVENAVAAFRRGAQDYLMKPVIFDELLAKIDHLMRYRQLLRENQALRRQLHAEHSGEILVGESPPMRGVKKLIRKVGPSRSNVLITGESGTGKELVARALHTASKDPTAPFLAVNCAAIPNDLLENQLFGHLRGAFTGADRDREGLFVAAGSGTVFLDEIGEMPLATQSKLLRAIETKEVLPVGATRPIAFASADPGGDEQGSGGGGGGGPVSGGSVLPAERRDDLAAAVAGAGGGHSGPDPGVVAEALSTAGEAGERGRQSDHPAAHGVFLERECAGAGQCAGTSGDLVRGADLDASGFLVGTGGGGRGLPGLGR